MAAKSFVICNINKFLEEDFKFAYQADLFETTEGMNDEGEQRIELNLDDRFNHIGVKRYNCTYDYIHKITGRVFNRVFHKYFEVFNFPIYLQKDTSLALIQLKTDTALEFTQHLNSIKEYSLDVMEVDFEKIIRNVPEISGAWVADLKGKHLKSAGLFGRNVHLSPEYQEAIKEGKISSMLITWIYEKTEFKINISKKGSITLLNKVSSPEIELDIILKLYNDLIKK